MLLSLPNELILEVVEKFTDTTDVFYLLMTSKHLANLLQPVLVKASNAILDSSAGSYLPLLHLAAAENKRTTAKLALKKDPGCLNNFVTDEGTALHVAVFEGFESMVEFLLAQGADPNAVNPNPQPGISPDTPLHLALSGAIEIQDAYIIQTIPMAKEGIVKLLLQRGADPNALGQNGMNALLQAARLGLPRIVSDILDTGLIDINSRTSTGRTALHVAVKGAAGEGSLRVAELLLERGIDVDATDEHGQTALFLAETEGVAALLLKYGTTVGVVDQTNRTVLHYLADCTYHNNSVLIVNQILNSGRFINVGLRDMNQRSALFYATMRNNAELMRILSEFR